MNDTLCCLYFRCSDSYPSLNTIREPSDRSKFILQEDNKPKTMSSETHGAFNITESESDYPEEVGHFC